MILAASGEEALQVYTEEGDRIRVIFCSGMPVIQKPFDGRTFMEKIKAGRAP